MSELLNSLNMTMFDVIVILLTVVSALMALARGFIREVASILAFLLALGAALFAYFYLTPLAKGALPDTIDPIMIEVVIVAVTFLFIYISAAWLGRKFSRFLHTSTDITLVDRVTGLVFGVARAFAIIVLVLFVSRPFIEEAEISWVLDSFSYPYFIQAVIWVQSVIPAVADNVQQAIPENLPDRS